MQYDDPFFRLCAWIDRGRVAAQWRIKLHHGSPAYSRTILWNNRITEFKVQVEVLLLNGQQNSGVVVRPPRSPKKQPESIVFILIAHTIKCSLNIFVPIIINLSVFVP